MRLVSWNILAGGGTRCREIVRRLGHYDADVLVLQETVTARAGDVCHALAAAGYVIDHAFASAALAERVTGCRYDHEVRERGWSDHSLLLVDLSQPVTTSR
jgi:exonuclease III